MDEATQILPLQPDAVTRASPGYAQETTSEPKAASPFAEGWIAYSEGKGERANPYPSFDPAIRPTLNWLAWRAGWWTHSGVKSGLAEGTLEEHEQQWRSEPWNRPSRFAKT